MQKITPFLWFNEDAEEAVNFYTSIFKNSKVGQITRLGDSVPGPQGKVLTATFQLEGLDLMALNGGPEYSFTPAFSFFVHCQTQEEVDYFWERLSEGGEKGPCGWLKDKFGVSWQIVPDILLELMADPDPEKARRVTQAMLKMGKIEIEGLMQAYKMA